MESKENSKLKALSEISSIDITLDFQKILHEILRISCKTMNGHSGSLMLMDEMTHDLKMVASHNLGDDFIKKVYLAAQEAGVLITSSPSGVVLETKMSYPVPNVFEEPRCRPWLSIPEELGFSAQLYTPMKKGAEVIGLLNVYMKDVHEFTSEEIDFMNIAASQAASVVHNARICARLKQNVNELKQYKAKLEDNIKESHKELYDSKNYLKMIIDSSFDGIFVVNAEGKFEFGNNAFFNIIGWPQEYIVGHFFMEIIPDYNKDFIWKRWENILNDNMDSFETDIFTKNGEKRYLLISHATNKIKREKKYIGIVKNITEYKKLELEVKESESRYRELFENAQEAICTIDVNGFFLTMNNAGLKIFGCSNDEIIGSKVDQWLCTNSISLSRSSFKKLLAGEFVEQPEVREIIRKNGEPRWIELTDRLIKGTDKITGVHRIFKDITEKKDMELKLRYYNEKLRMSFEKLKIAENKYRQLFENANDGICYINLDGKIRNINKAGLKIFGTTKEEIKETRFFRWLSPEYSEVFKTSLKKLPSEGSIQFPSTQEIICFNGDHRWIDISARVVRHDNMVDGLHCIIRDITEKRIMEQTLIEYHEKLEKSIQELKESDRIKSEFISNITHELLTPLTSIRGFSELLHDGKIGTVTDEQKKSIKTILRNSNRLTRLIKDLLAASKLETEILELKFKPVLLNEVISKSIQDILPNAEEKGIKIDQNIELLPAFYGDEEGMTQVVTNLLINAIKFTPQNGTVKITAKDCDDEIRIYVTDTGIGIPPDKLPHIFEKFYQVDGTSSRKYGGVGLGLSICRSIVEKHSGVITAQSDKYGSTFEIILPKTL